MHNSDHGVRAGLAALLDLLADLLLHELEAPLAAVLAGDPALAGALEPPQGEAALRDLRAAYARLFLIDVPPYASVYLDMPPVINGEASLAWEKFLAAHGRAPASLERAAAADHAGLYLRALAAAQRSGSLELIRRVLYQALQWLPQALTAIKRNDQSGFYARVADLAAYAIQSCAVATPWEDCSSVEEQPISPDPGGDSLREIAQQLCTPAWSGWFISKRLLRRLAMPFGVAVGIVGRDRVLEQVFEASALDERTGELLDALLEERRSWQAAMEAWRTELGAWATALESWDAGLQRTCASLQDMRAALVASACNMKSDAD